MNPARILVIEDENKTAAFLSKGLREAGFAVDVAPRRRDRLGAGTCHQGLIF